ncbi:MAG TPA: glycoside hydrolase family 28 protein [Bryobacteraceae bacterium]|nr:glycoside hydrolase family 28 protein [Bryobacteraceae bacterium]
MPTQNNLRRDFLWLAGAGISGAALPVRADQGAPSAAGTSTSGTFDVKAFGATGGGKTPDTASINKAIDAAHAAGGGTVLFSAGDYLSYSIHLKSGVTLHLEPGSTIIAADPPGDGAGDGYDLAEPNAWDMYQDYGHSHFHNSLIWGEDIEDIAITGTGRIWGKGLTRGPGAATPRVGNKSISLKNCHNVLLRDFSILHGGHFGILATGVDNLTIDNLMIDTNRDGMDVDACRNVRISNCYVNSPWDDGICLKADYSLGRAKQTEFVTIVNCYVSGCWQEGTLLDGTYKRFEPGAHVPHTGRIKFGTESNGGFRNITISNCVFEGCQGLALESVDGALLEDITVTNISMRDIPSAPIFMRLGSRMRGPDKTPVGTLRRVIISNLVCSNSSPGLGSVICGIPGHLVEDVKISNIQILHQGGGTKEDAAYQPPEYEDKYPEPNMFVTGPRPNDRAPDGRWIPEGQGPARPRRSPEPPHNMPSHGFYVRHVKGIQFDNIQIRADREDLRPAFVLDDVHDADFFRIRLPQAAGVPAFALRNVSDLAVHMCAGVPDTQLAAVESKTL